MLIFLFQFLFSIASLGQLLEPRALAQEEQDSTYERFIRKEQEKQKSTLATAKLASGFAGLAIGLYGYYNDDRGVLARVIYAATQTAGVLIVGEAIKERNSPNYFLITDKYIKQYESTRELSAEEFKKELVEFKQKEDSAEKQKIAYTSAILALLYFYNGYREGSENPTIRNIYYFLGANASLISAASFYKVNLGSSSDNANIDVRVFPDIAITARF